MRPLGQFPPWDQHPTGIIAPPGVGFTPGTEDPNLFNWLFQQFGYFLDVRDGYELLNWGERYALDINSPDSGGADVHWNHPDDYWRHSAIGYAGGLYLLGVRNHGDPSRAGLLWSRDGRQFTEDTSVAHVVATPDFSFYSVCMTPEQNALAWLTCVTGVTPTSLKYYLKTEYTLTPLPNGDWNEIFPSAGSVWENAVWSEDDARFYCIGWNLDDTPTIARLMFVDLTGVATFWAVDNVPDDTRGLHVAVSTTDRLVAGSDDLWWGQNASSTFRHYSRLNAGLFNLRPGEDKGQIKGLIWNATDEVFVLVTELAVWTSANGVMWTKALEAVNGLFVGPVTALGGSVAVSFRQQTGSTFAYTLWVGTNAMRSWVQIPLPAQDGTDDSALPLSGLYTLGQRSAVLNNRPQGGIRYSLR